jgi:hypothetical protein
MQETEEERFRFKVKEHLSPRSLPARSGNTLVATCDPDNVQHLEAVLEKNNPKRSDIVVMLVNPKVDQDIEKTAEDAGRVMDPGAIRVFSKAVHIAEKLGKPLSLLAVPGRDAYALILEAAQKLNSSRVVVGKSSRSIDKQKHDLVRAWKQLPQHESEVSVEIFRDDDDSEIFQFRLHK